MCCFYMPAQCRTPCLQWAAGEKWAVRARGTWDKVSTELVLIKKYFVRTAVPKDWRHQSAPFFSVPLRLLAAPPAHTLEIDRDGWLVGSRGMARALVRTARGLSSAADDDDVDKDKDKGGDASEPSRATAAADDDPP